MKYTSSPSHQNSPKASISQEQESWRYHLPSIPDSEPLENFQRCFSWNATNSTLNGNAFTTHYFHRNHSFQKHSKVLSRSLNQQLKHSTTCMPCSCAVSRSLLGQKTYTNKTMPGSLPLILLAVKILCLFLRFITFYFFLVWISWR